MNWNGASSNHIWRSAELWDPTLLRGVRGPSGRNEKNMHWLASVEWDHPSTVAFGLWGSQVTDEKSCCTKSLDLHQTFCCPSRVKWDLLPRQKQSLEYALLQIVFQKILEKYQSSTRVIESISLKFRVLQHQCLSFLKLYARTSTLRTTSTYNFGLLQLECEVLETGKNANIKNWWNLEIR